MKINLATGKKKNLGISIFFGLCLLLISACSASQSPDVQSPQAAYIIEPVFEEFYDFLGAQAHIGLPLSPLIFDGQLQKQYFEAALLIFNPSAALSERYTLAPLGLQMGQTDEPLANPNLPDVLFVDGFIVYEAFVELYEQIGGRRYVGRPLTGVRYIESQNRVEQYFENVGFYLHLDDQQQGVQLMAYGRLACAQQCGAFSESPAAIAQIDLPYSEPFVTTAASLGDALLGARIAGPYQNNDGSLEVIYENMLLFAQPDSSQASPRAFLASLGILPAPLVPRLDNPNVIFYGIEGDLGHNVPLVFSKYIAAHGGFEISGVPISELEPLENGTSRQCFANLCLLYTPSVLGNVEPLPLGEEYKRRFYDQPAPQILDEDLDIQIQLWEERSRISSFDQQIVHASLFAGNQLLSGLQPYLLLSLPNGGESLYQFPPSDESGQTQLTLPAVSGQNGTLIIYEVCLEGPQIGKICSNDSYMIWGNP